VSPLANAVFLSYASQDAAAARRLRDALQAAGLEVWFDQSALRGGDAWDASIRRQIKACTLFVPIISANTQAREEGYFRREWNLAADRTLDMADDRTFLLPVVIDATRDVSARVPEKFREVQWTRLPAGEMSAAFVDRVRRLLAGVAAPPATASMRASAAPRREPPSIAVLPFVNRSHDRDDEYFSDGLADELLNVLAKIRGLRVAAHSSAFSFKGKGATVADVGRALNVATVLEGSVRKAGNRMRVAVQLVKVADGDHLWAETYDRALDDVFAIQDDIAQAVVKELRSTLLGEVTDATGGREATAQVAAAAKGRSSDPEAHRLFLQARHFIERRTRPDLTKGIDYLIQALDLDPVFALAWVALGGAYTVEADCGWVSVAEGFARGREAVARALVLEPDLAEAHSEMGWIQMSHDWNWRAAEASLRRALELAPGNATVLSAAGVLAANRGRLDEAIERYRETVQQDPLRAVAYVNLGGALHAHGRLAEAEAAYRKAIELAPERSNTPANLAVNLLAQGRVDEALAEVLREPEEVLRLWALAIIHHAAGRRNESNAALEALIAQYRAEAPYQVAMVYAAQAEVDLAFEWLERAFDHRDPGLSGMKIEPLLRCLHADPRWEATLRKMNLADRGESA